MSTFESSLGYVINLDFDTHESMIEAALHWNFEEYQFGRGPFNAYINAIHTLNIQLANTFRSNGIFIKGKTPKNAYMFAYVKSKGKKTHNGLSILEDELVVLTENDQLDYIVSSTVEDVTIAINKDFFDDAFKNYFNEPFKYDKINKRISLKKNRRSEFITSLKEVLRDLIEQNTKLQDDPDFHEKMEHTILQIIFHNINPSTQRKPILQSEINANEMRKYIETNYNKNFNISECCFRKRISERTLRLSFKNLFGVSPKQYHKYYRFGKIHHTLLKSDYPSQTIENIAYDHGFTHMGRFSNNYKSMFGNTPSHTLKKLSP